MRTEPARQVIAGVVAANGSITSGTGFQITKGAAGTFTLRFTPPLRTPPAIAMNTVGTLGLIALGGVPTRDGVTIYTYTTASVSADIAFSFEAVAT